MHSSTSLKNPVITGTLILTLAGSISRIIGFFYRIFLSHTIGADGIGLYQLAVPVSTLSFAISCAGIQTAISRFTARHRNGSDPVSNDQDYLISGMLFSLFLALLCMAFFLFYPDWIAATLLKESQCAPLVSILALSIPCAAIHSCVNGYFYGKKKSLFPSISQLAEQLARVAFVYLLYQILLSQHRSITPAHAAWGIVAGEAVSMLLSLTVTGFHPLPHKWLQKTGEIAKMAAPISANRLSLTIFQSFETILIPTMLTAYGYTRTQALSVFGILTGMALPVILFPSVLTNSFATLLLPVISEAQASHRHSLIQRAISRSILSSLIMGFACTLGFLLFGRAMGHYLFHNKLAGTFILSLGWLCPFLYLNTTLNSILHGLGKTTTSLCLNVSGCVIRILAILFFIPLFGLKAYMAGLLISYSLVSLLASLFCYRYGQKS